MGPQVWTVVADGVKRHHFTLNLRSTAALMENTDVSDFADLNDVPGSQHPLCLAFSCSSGNLAVEWSCVRPGRSSGRSVQVAEAGI